MKPVPASTCGCIIERNLQIILGEKPVEDPMRFLEPRPLAHREEKLSSNIRFPKTALGASRLDLVKYVPGENCVCAC
jgi:hypothetical protein